MALIPEKAAVIQDHPNIQAKIAIMMPRKAGLVMMTMIIVGAQLFLEGIITMLPKSCNSLVTKCPRALPIWSKKVPMILQNQKQSQEGTLKALSRSEICLANQQATGFRTYSYTYWQPQAQSSSFSLSCGRQPRHNSNSNQDSKPRGRNKSINRNTSITM